MYWPGGVRHRGGVNLTCGFRRERWKARLTLPPVERLTGDEREPPKRQKPQGTEYRCCGAPADRLVVAVKGL
jgi:hypothetical protein